jgi:PleD family two-component response regulator
MNVSTEAVAMRIPTAMPKFKDAILKYSLRQKCCNKVLIVDDEYFNILALKVIMRNIDTTIDHCFNGMEAL